MQQAKTILFKGRPYVTVAERVRMVHEQKCQFEVLDSIFQEVCGRVICKVTILVDGKRFAASAEAKLTDAVAKSADATNPFECAETSALGRALAFAGLGTVDGIASYDEMARGQSFADLAQDRQEESDNGPDQPKKITYITKEQTAKITTLCRDLGHPQPQNLRSMTVEAAKEEIARLAEEFHLLALAKKAWMFACGEPKETAKERWKQYLLLLFGKVPIFEQSHLDRINADLATRLAAS